MKIRVKSYLNITGLKRERVVATKEDITLKDFLIDLSNRYDKKIKNFTQVKLAVAIFISE